MKMHRVRTPRLGVQHLDSQYALEPYHWDGVRPPTVEA